MEIKVNIEKRHLFVFSIIIGILIGVFVVYAYNTPPVWSGPGAAVPANFGHSVDEIEWGQTIQNNVNLGGNLYVRKNVEPLISLDNTAYRTYDIFSGGGTGAVQYNNKFVIYDRDASADRLVLDNIGNVGIGTANPTAKLEVNGDIHSSGKIYNSKTCRIFANNNGNLAGQVSVPIECTDSECLIAIQIGGTWSFTNLVEGTYNFGGTIRNVWSTSSSLTGGINGNGFGEDILSLVIGNDRVSLVDDSATENSLNQWSWNVLLFATNFNIWVCS